MSLRDVERFVTTLGWCLEHLESKHLGKMVFEKSMEADEQLRANFDTGMYDEVPQE